jgi:hypothetical protein
MPQWDAKFMKVVDPSAHATLVRELAQATRRLASASMELNAITRNFPAGIPPPEGNQGMQNASNALGIARKEMETAQTRLDDYLDYGMVPED